MSLQTVSTKLARIAKQSERNPEMVFTTLMHLVDVEFLTEAFGRLRKKAACGVDKVTVGEYTKDLHGNLIDLHQRLKTNRYRAQPAKRAWAPKDDGSRRPLAILVLEDKIVQKAVSMLLEAVYEPMFYDFSYGFRPKRGAHQAIRELREQILSKNISWVVDADISGYFDGIDRKHLRTAIEQRVKDGGVQRLLGKWLNAGVIEDDKVTYSDTGVQQGGVISPILANIFLHYVLDKWFEKEVRPRMRGRCFIIRFADDFVLGFENQSDAERTYEVLPKRFGRYGLSIHPKKSRLVQFNRPGGNSNKGTGTFDFLGFTHYWAKSLRGTWIVKRKTQSKRLKRAMSAIWTWCKYNRHMQIDEQHQKLCAKLRGHYQYYGIRGNYKMLEVMYEHLRKAWKRWLGRRTRNGYIKWEDFANKYDRVYPLPKPRIVHSF